MKEAREFIAMATISLRAYQREIENKIEAGLTDEAINHCHHILRIFPKHVDTYRLLGKAYMETQRYGEATDVLQRVLSSIPDDFIAHLGMSIIREDEGVLDAAIWHMERAFEVQPANSAVQDELRRLYGARDGFEPTKVQLTRGALARMYIKGELYPQAVAELRTALREEPDRLDLMLLLARTFHAAGQRVEAVETCNGLLAKLPYCLEANQIMAEILTESDTAAEADIYLRRVRSVDLYSAHLSENAHTVDLVPDAAVSLERYEWKPGITRDTETPQPDWMASLRSDLKELDAEAEALPEWMKFESQVSEKEEGGGMEGKIPEEVKEGEAATAGEFEPVTGESESKETVETPTGELIPEWMKSTGWEPATAKEETPPSPQDFSEEAEELKKTAELPGAELPDWLQAIAPEGMIGSAEKGEVTSTPADTTEPGSDAVAAWLSKNQNHMHTGQLIAPTTSDDVEIPDWLRGLAGESPVDVDGLELTDTGEDGDQPEAAESAIDFPQEEYADLEVEPELSVQEDQTGLPTWLQDEALEKSDRVFDGEEDLELPDWLPDVEGEVLMGSSEEVTSQEATTQEEPALREEAEEEEVELRAEVYRTPTEPLEMQFVEEELETSPEAGDIVGEEYLADEVPYLREQEAAEFTEMPGETLEGTEEISADVLFAGEVTAAQEELAGIPVRIGDEEEVEALEELEAYIQDSETIEPPKIPEEKIDTARLSPESLPGWDGELKVGPEVPVDYDLPDWVFNLKEEPVQEEMIAEPAELPEWLQNAASDINEADDQVEKLPEWYFAPAEDEEQAEMEVASQELGQIPEQGDTQPVKIKDEMLEPEGVEDLFEEEVVEEKETVDFLDSEPAERLSTHELEDEEAAIAWLDSLASRQVTVEDEQVDQQDEVTTEPPQWILEAAAGVETELEAESASTEKDTEWISEEFPDEEEEEIIEAEGPAFEKSVEEAQLIEEADVVEEEPLIAGVSEIEMDLETSEVFETIEEASIDLDEGPPQEVLQEVTEEVLEVSEVEEEVETFEMDQILAEPAMEAAVEEILPSEYIPESDIEVEMEKFTEESGLPAIEPVAEVETLEGQEIDQALPLPDWLVDISTAEELDLQIIEADQPLEEEIEIVEPEIEISLPEAEVETIEPEPEGEVIISELDEEAINPADEEVVTFDAALEGLEPALQVEPSVEEISIETESAEPDLVVARRALEVNDLETAIIHYNQLIKAEVDLEEIIRDLNEAIFRYPVDIRLYEAVGDAYVRTDLLQQALDAYTKAEELLH
jgi:tetratricopeptide (TPR) repeat protein